MKAKEAYYDFITYYDPYYPIEDLETEPETMIYNLKEIRKDLEEVGDPELITKLDNALALLEGTTK